MFVIKGRKTRKGKVKLRIEVDVDSEGLASTVFDHTISNHPRMKFWSLDRVEDEEEEEDEAEEVEVEEEEVKPATSRRKR